MKPKESVNGAPILTGRGLEDVKRRIAEAFAVVRQPVAPQPKVEVVYTEVYTEHHEERFHQRTKKLELAALTKTPQVSRSTRSVWEIAAPRKSAEELIEEAMRRLK